MSARILVAGIGNIFFADDGFGVEVARRLGETEMPDGVTVVDYGIRGVHLAYDLLGGYDVTILVDALSRGDAPGTVYVVDVTDERGRLAAQPRQLDPHGMTPDAVLEHVATLGGNPGRVYVVGCEPADVEEGIGLSDVVAGAIPSAVSAVRELVEASAMAARSSTACVMPSATSRAPAEPGDRKQIIDRSLVNGPRDTEV